MRTRNHRSLRRRFGQESGATAVEYALFDAVLGVGLVAATAALEAGLSLFFEAQAQELTGPSASEVTVTPPAAADEPPAPANPEEPPAEPAGGGTAEAAPEIDEPAEQVGPLSVSASTTADNPNWVARLSVDVAAPDGTVIELDWKPASAPGSNPRTCQIRDNTCQLIGQFRRTGSSNGRGGNTAVPSATRQVVGIDGVTVTGPTGTVQAP